MIVAGRKGAEAANVAGESKVVLRFLLNRLYISNVALNPIQGRCKFAHPYLDVTKTTRKQKELLFHFFHSTDTVFFRSMCVMVTKTLVKFHYDMKMISGEKVERRDRRREGFDFFLFSFGLERVPYKFPQG